MLESKNIAAKLVNDFKNKNLAVIEAYDSIVSDIKEQLKRFPTEQTRTFVEADLSVNGTLDRRFYSPILTVSVSDWDNENMISFSKNFDAKPYVGLQRDIVLFRIIYKHTTAGNTTIDIEDCLEEHGYDFEDYEQALKECDAGNPRYERTIL